MKIINLIKSEFLKNYSIKKIVIITLFILIFTITFIELNLTFSLENSKEKYCSTIFEITDNMSNIEKEYKVKVSENLKNINDYSNGQYCTTEPYKNEMLRELEQAIYTNGAIDIYRKYKDSDEIKYICKSNKQMYYSEYEGLIAHVCSMSNNELDEMQKEYKDIIDNYAYLLKENKYYKYLQYKKDKDLIDKEDMELAKIVIDNKIDSFSNYLSTNYRQHTYLFDEFTPMSEEEFNEYENDYSSYDSYIRFGKGLVSEHLKMRKIVNYSSKNKIPHDLSFNWMDQGNLDRDNNMTTKKNVNLIFHYSIIVMLIVSFTSGGIVAKEHRDGTIKKIITTPIKRWKLILSKFIYLILHTYIIWMICLVILSIYSGIKFGFNDLFTPKLIYINNKVVEVNYYLYLLKDLFIASIPIICFLSILLFISTISINSSLTTGICSLISILSLIIWFIADKFKLLIVTPFMYFDIGFMYTRSETYMYILKNTNITYSYGIVISILVALLLFVFTNIYYNKKDIMC